MNRSTNTTVLGERWAVFLGRSPASSSTWSKDAVNVSALTWGVQGARAQLNDWLTSVQVSVGGQGNSLQFAFDGGLNTPSSYVTLVTSGAAPEASSSLSAGGYIPELKVRALADPTRSQAVAWGVQGYTNNSVSPLDTSLIMNLSADITGSNDLDARVYLFEDDNFEFAALPGTILFETSSQLWPGFESFANNLGPDGFDVDIKNYEGPVNKTRQFDFTVSSGECFYVWARLVGTADQPGEVDAWTTLTASLTNTDPTWSTEGMASRGLVAVPTTTNRSAPTPN